MSITGHRRLGAHLAAAALLASMPLEAFGQSSRPLREAAEPHRVRRKPVHNTPEIEAWNAEVDRQKAEKKARKGRP